MPKVVDHEARRQVLAATAADVIARLGVENATLRDIAHEAGFSTGIVGHYFRNKDELMLQALEHVDQCVARRFSRLRNRSLKRALETILPLDAERRAEWRVRINFWGRAMIQAELAQTLAESMVASQQAMEEIIEEERSRSRIRQDIDATAAAESMINLTISLSLKILFQPNAYPQHRVRQKVADCVDELAES